MSRSAPDLALGAAAVLAVASWTADRVSGSSNVWRQCPPWRRRVVVEGLPPVTQIPERFITQQGVNRLRYVDWVGTRSTTRRYDRVANRAVELLRQHRIHLDRVIGRGRYAEVHSIVGDPDQVVKISGDLTEAAAWAYLLEMIDTGELSWEVLPSLPRVTCVMVVEPKAKADRPLYIIVMERCRPLVHSERVLVERIDEVLLSARGNSRSGLWAPYTVEGSIQGVVRRFTSVSHGSKHAKRLIETLQCTASHSLYIFDIHAENVMRDSAGDWKITDLGMTESCCPVAIPVLESP